MSNPIRNLHVNVCSKCHTSIQNDDWTWIDNFVETPEESLEEYGRLTASAEGLIADNTTVVPDGYWRCFVCDEDTLGTAYGYYSESD